MKIRVMIADDHPVVREGLRGAITQNTTDIEVVAEARNGPDLLAQAESTGADVYVVDVSMPLLNGIETAARLRRLDPRAKILMLSIHDSEAIVARAIEAGIDGYLLKESAVREVIQAIREVHRGRFFLSPGISRFVVEGFLGRRRDSAAPRRKGDLTLREREVLQLVAEGFTTKGIAERLGLSPNTVRVHKNSIRSKLGLHRQSDLIRYAVREGIATV